MHTRTYVYLYCVKCGTSERSFPNSKTNIFGVGDWPIQRLANILSKCCLGLWLKLDVVTHFCSKLPCVPNDPTLYYLGLSRRSELLAVYLWCDQFR